MHSQYTDEITGIANRSPSFPIRKIRLVFDFSSLQFSVESSGRNSQIVEVNCSELTQTESNRTDNPFVVFYGYAI